MCIFVDVCICLYISMYMKVYMYMYIHICIYIYVCVCVCAYKCIYEVIYIYVYNICIHTFMHAFIYIYIYIHTHIHIWMHVCMNRYIFIYVCVCFVCMCVSTPQHEQDRTHGQYFEQSFTGLNSKFSFSIVSYTRLKEAGLLYYLPITGGRIIPKSICDKQNANCLVWDLNSSRQAHFLHPYSLHSKRPCKCIHVYLKIYTSEHTHIYIYIYIVIHRQTCFVLSEPFREARFPKLGSELG